ncbi:AraC family transcriptional regulator [Ekhidna sp.]|uniref:AraC family transcriptional regulator n=1 Tax=Ekhidna sp. TaxID=2608089 RepID=UPI003517B269
MNFHFHIPEGILALYVESIVYFDSYSPDHEKERLLPDGRQTLIIDLTERPKSIFDNSNLAEKQQCKRFWFSGARNELLTIDSGGRMSSMMVVNFTYAGAYAFVQQPTDQLQGSVVDADLLFHESIANLREDILEKSSALEKFKLMEDFLAKRISSKTIPLAIVQTTALIAKNPTSGTIKWISENSGYSQKHFIALFKKYVGLTPKGFQKVMRFQKVVNDLQNTNQINWTQLALDCGYYDQAHFINEFKIFSGYNPNQYLTEKGPDLNYIPLR